MKTLKLFNAVLSKESDENIFVSEEGFIIEPSALWAKKEITNFFKKEFLDANDLNSTFHKSWAKIKSSSRFELYLHQIVHYASTYGSNFTGEVYLPNEEVNLPDIKITLKVFKAYSKEEMTVKCLRMLSSGIALKEETINDLLSVLIDELGYTFTGKEVIKNKEAVIKLADVYGVVPVDTLEFFRFIIYKASGKSLLIKDKQLISLIKSSSYNPAVQFKKFGLEKLAEIFNRYKPLFLAFKGTCPKTINKISKLSKSCHKPMPQNPLNMVTNSLLTEKDMGWVKKASIYALFKAISACHARIDGQESFVYRIRNGKSWIAKGCPNIHIAQENFDTLINYLKTKIDIKDKKIFIPSGVEFALPTSEKMFVGNIPTGTRFFGKKMAVGVYWRNEWGARDIDVSGINVSGKVGWNSDYKQGIKSLMYSGDITNAPEGAVEYLYANKSLSDVTLVKSNIFSGDSDCEYKIVVGKGDKISHDFMMNPNNLIADIRCKSVQKETIIGMFIPDGEKQSFVLLNFGAGHARVSGNDSRTSDATKALFSQWKNAFSLNTLVKRMGAEIVDSETNCDYNFSLKLLEKDSFIKFFEEVKSI